MSGQTSKIARDDALIAGMMAIAAFAVTAFAPQVMNDPDTWWHLAAGRWIIENRAIPHVDVFSHSMAGEPWTAHEWLSEVVMQLAFMAGGWSGLLVLFGAAMAATIFIIARRVGRSVSEMPLLAVLAIAFSCMAPSLLVRPHVLVLPLTALWTEAMLSAREKGRAPSWWLIPVMVLWANLHGSYVFGFALAAPFALEALLEAKTWPDRRRVVTRWGVFGVACLAAAAVTPHGPMGLLFPLQLMSMTANVGISEWQSTDFSTLGPFEVALLALLATALRFPMKLPIVRLVLLLVLTHMALKHGRHVTVWAIVTAMVLAAPLGLALNRASNSIAWPRGVLAAAFAVVAALGIGRLLLPVVRVDSEVAPIKAVASVPADVRAQPVLNEYGFGGYLIWMKIPPYIDGRADMYGDDFMHAYYRLIRPDPAALEQALVTSRIGWTIFPAGHPVASIMDTKADWRRHYADEHAVVHVRAETRAAQAASTSQPR